MFFEKLEGQDSRAKVFIVVVSPALYNSPVCLEEISRALVNKQVMRRRSCDAFPSSNAPAFTLI